MKKLLIGLLCVAVSTALYAEEEKQESAILNFPYYEASIKGIQSKILSHEKTCEAITQSFLERVLKYDMATNKRIPFNAIQVINENVLAQAKKLDAYFKKHGALYGSLHCIPVVINDNISTAELPMTAGTYALLGNRPNYTAPVLKHIQKAGGIILASATMDELSDGKIAVSSRHGRTANAYEMEQAAGGASGGSAVAVSLNFSMLGLGTDLNGSARLPASRNGLYSIRPTLGLVSNKGVFTPSPLGDLISPMARTPHDLAVFLSVLAKEKPNTYTRHLHKGFLQGKRIGLLQSINGQDLYADTTVKYLKRYKGFIKRLKGLGAHIILKVSMDDLKLKEDIHQIDIEAMDLEIDKYPSVRKDFQDLCESQRSNHFEKNCDEISKKGKVDLKGQLANIEHNHKVFKKLMKAKQLNLVLIPLDIHSDHIAQQQLSEQLGAPTMTILTGYEPEGIPLSMQLVAKPYDEKSLLAAAYDFDVHFTPRSAPTLWARPQKEFSSIKQFNFFKDALGKYIFENYLIDHDYNTLTAKKFANLYRKFLKRSNI